MLITVSTFDKGDNEEKARKVCEEAMEFYAEYRVSRISGIYPLLLEIGDVFTALANFCAANDIDPQECVDLVETKNVVRGYYDTMES